MALSIYPMESLCLDCTSLTLVWWLWGIFCRRDEQRPVPQLQRRLRITPFQSRSLLSIRRSCMIAPRAKSAVHLARESHATPSCLLCACMTWRSILMQVSCSRRASQNMSLIQCLGPYGANHLGRNVWHLCLRLRLFRTNTRLHHRQALSKTAAC